MSSLSLIHGLDLIYTVRLEILNIYTTEDLLARARRRGDRKVLADEIWINERELLHWVWQADLYRIRGLGHRHMKLLRLCEVNTTSELANCSARDLTKRINELCDSKNLCQIRPGVEKIEFWIEQAKLLEKIVYDE